jgi:histone deacetylase complex regulatory component SIN3
MQGLLKNVFQNDVKTFEDVFKCIQLYSFGVMSIKEFEEVIAKAFEDHGAEKEKEMLLRLLSSRCVGRRQFSWCCRPSSDLVHARCKRTGSYLMLPDEYPAIISTGRESMFGKELEKELNDLWISVSSGSEDFSFKIYRKNIYEEQLCKSEDERFEHDMAINYSDFAIESFEELLRELPGHIAAGDMYLCFKPLVTTLIIDVVKEDLGVR